MKCVDGLWEFEVRRDRRGKGTDRHCTYSVLTSAYTEYRAPKEKKERRLSFRVNTTPAVLIPPTLSRFSFPRMNKTISLSLQTVYRASQPTHLLWGPPSTFPLGYFYAIGSGDGYLSLLPISSCAHSRKRKWVSIHTCTSAGVTLSPPVGDREIPSVDLPPSFCGRHIA